MELVKGCVGGNPGAAKYGFESVILGLDASFFPFPFLLLSPSKGTKNKNAGTCCFIFHSRN